MRRQIAILALFALLLSGCTLLPKTGSGDIVTQTRSVPSFHTVAYHGSGEVYITQGTTDSVKITAEDNVLDHLVTTVSNGALDIYTDEYETIIPTEIVKVHITVDDLRKVELSGGATLKGENTITSDSLRIEVSGSSDEITLDVDCEELETVVSGAATMHLSGTAGEHTSKVSGTADVNAFGLTTERTAITISGIADYDVYASKRLDVFVSGSGQVYYKGSPATVNKDISGLAEVVDAS